MPYMVSVGMAITLPERNELTHRSMVVSRCSSFEISSGTIFSMTANVNELSQHLNETNNWIKSFPIMVNLK